LDGDELLAPALGRLQPMVHNNKQAPLEPWPTAPAGWTWLAFPACERAPPVGPREVKFSAVLSGRGAAMGAAAAAAATIMRSSLGRPPKEAASGSELSMAAARLSYRPSCCSLRAQD